MSNSKLKNIDAIKKMLRGDHRMQERKIFYTGNGAKGRMRAAEFNVGDCWHEKNENGSWITYFKLKGRVEEARGKWESYNAYIASKQNTEDKFNWLDWKFRNCDPENKQCERGLGKKSAKIERLVARTGMCLDCLSKYELKLQIEGKFNDYAMDKMRSNMESYIRDQEIELEKWKVEMRRGVDVLLNGDGQVEKMSIENVETMIERLDAEWQEYKKMLYTNYGVEEHES